MSNLTQNEAGELSVMFDARSEAGRDRDRAGRELSSLIQQFTAKPTEELAKSINLKMATYAIADDNYRSACEAFDALAAR